MYGSGHMTGNKQTDLVALLGDDLVMTGQNDMLGYCRDWPGDVANTAVAVIRPRSTEGVSAAVKACASLGLSIIPQGGNTGLVQGGVPDGQDNLVILSLERMNRIRKIDPDDFSAIVDAGCILS
ncbi:MAG: FAD-binding oxidoreductase, partial [Candidatus Binatia bacterium]